MSFVHFMKMSWMGVWRSFLLAVILQDFTPVLIGFPLTFVLTMILLAQGFTIHAFPLFNLFVLRRNPFYRFRGVPGESRRKAKLPQRPVLQAASANGPRTGYEPSRLAPVAVAWNPRVYGNPGYGLGGTQNKFSASAVALGQQGEMNFAKALSVYPAPDHRAVLRVMTSFWSVAMPSREDIYRADPVLNTDVDCILLVGNTLYLVDLKNYKGGAITYETAGDQLLAVDNATGALVGEPKRMTKNMEIALQRFKAHFPKLNVEARVIFMPTEKGAATVKKVYWPGRIPALNLKDFLSEIALLNAPLSRHGVEAEKLIPYLVKR